MIVNPPFGASLQPARYWRVYVTAVQGGGGQVEIGTLEMRDTAGGADLTGSGTPSASSSENSPGLPVANAFDGLASSGWRSDDLSSLPQWIAYDFGSPVTIREIAINSTSNVGIVGYSPNRLPKTFKLQWSLDNSLWHDAWLWDLNITWTYQDTGQQLVRLTVGTVPTYYRIYVTSNHGKGYAEIYDVELRTSHGGSQAALNGGSSASSYDNVDTAPALAFSSSVKGAYGAGWTSNNSQGTPWILYFGVFYTDPVFTEASIKVANTGNVYGEPGSWPFAFTIDKTHNFSGSWTQLYSQITDPSWTSGVAQQFSW